MVACARDAPHAPRVVGAAEAGPPIVELAPSPKRKKGERRAVASLAWSAAGKLAAGCDDGTLQIWELSDVAVEQQSPLGIALV